MSAFHRDKERRVFASTLDREHRFYGAQAIYVLQEKDDAAGPVKIGICQLPISRLAQFQVGNWREVEFVFFRWCAGRPIARRIEAEVHERFKGRHIRGEWFSVSADEAGTAIIESAKGMRAWLRTHEEMRDLYSEKVVGAWEKWLDENIPAE